jgi:hypothetical protein
MQVLCELVYLHGAAMAAERVQMSDVSVPVRARIRRVYYTGTVSEHVVIML